MRVFILFSLFLFSLFSGFGQEEYFSYLDVFALQHVRDPQIAPNGTKIVYQRMQFDVMEDRSKGNLWIINADGTQHQKLSSREVNESSPRWSPKGDRLAFISSTDEGAELFMYWVTTGKIAKISQLPYSPQSLTWSPKGDQLAFSMHVDKAAPVFAKMPKKPKGAKWSPAPRITDRVYHEADGRGYIKPGFHHIFVIPATGGAPRQLTTSDFHHRGNLSWTPDGESIYFSGNLDADWEYHSRQSNLYRVQVNEGTVKAITQGQNRYSTTLVSPNGKQLAYMGFEDKVQDYQVRKLYTSNLDGSNARVISKSLDRSVYNLLWNSKSDGLYLAYDDKGNSKIARISLNGKLIKLADNMGGTSIGRPYAGGSFSVSVGGTIAFTESLPQYPAELAVRTAKNKKSVKTTSLNGALLNFRTLGKVEEIWYTSSYDQRNIQGWVVYPPNYDSAKKYPFMVENHGGPILNYGNRFSAEMQLYAAAGYIVFYPNQRGSTSYGEEFGNLLYNNYPGQDYTDVMDGVDYCIS